jgi:hypothetical protein
MSQTFINGAKYSFSTTLAAAVAIASISNADPAVATAVGAAPAEGDIVLLSSNWTELNELATYADAVAGLNFALAQIDTTDERLYPPGESAGNYRIAGGFTSLSQIRDIQQSGGDTNNFTWGYIDDASPRQRSKPTDQNPLVLTFVMDYDPELPWVDALEALTKSRQLVVMRETLTTGDVLLYTGYIAYQKSPSRVRNENMTVTAVMSVNSDILRFPASFFSGS